mgnify:CR=1 FL=1
MILTKFRFPFNKTYYVNSEIIVYILIVNALFFTHNWVNLRQVLIIILESTSNSNLAAKLIWYWELYDLGMAEPHLQLSLIVEIQEVMVY